MKTNNPKGGILIPCFILLISIIITVAIGIHRYGDSSYKAMAYSLINEGDLTVDNQDIARWNRGKMIDIPVGVFIRVDSNGVMKYSKPILYPLIAAPFLFLGFFGVALLNGLFLGGIVLINYFFTREYFTKIQSLFISVLFILCSFVPVYAAWMTPEMMLFFACSLCIWLGMYKNRAVSAALIIGIVSSAKIPFFLLLVPLIAIKIAQKEIKEAFKALGMFLLGIAAMFFLTFLFQGKMLSYSGLRGYFFIKSPQYITLELLRNNLIMVKTQLDGFNFHNLGLFFINLSNFFIGRFTGIIWYALPGFITACVYLWYRKKLLRLEKIIGDSILMVTSALILILITARPLNYFGGKAFIGNRYFFIFPALFFLPSMRLIKKPQKFAMILLPGVLISSQIIKNQFFTEKISKYSYSFPFSAHTNVFPLKYAPLEIHQVELFNLPKIAVSENIELYAPWQQKPRISQSIRLYKGEEVVILQKDKTGNLKLETDRGEIVLQPAVTLKSKLSAECRSFYYFKAKQLIQINNIHS